MSAYFVQGRGWRFDFTHKGIRHTGAWFKTKREAMRAEAKRRKEVENPKQGMETQIAMGFLELVNRRLDHVKAYESESYYRTCVYLARRWVRRWGNLRCRQITPEMVTQFVLERSKVSSFTANKEISYLRASFNYGKKKNLITENPTDGIDFLPVNKKIKYVPPSEDIDKVIALADSETQDYLWTIRETIARVGEINRLTWDDVNLKDRYVVLYTRKKKGGHLTPRKVPMTQKLYEILNRRYLERDKIKPWVFWHTYWSSRTGEKQEGPFQDRKKIMKTLCRRAGVKYFRFHALRHSGASIMDRHNASMGAIQRILGHENRRTTEIYLHSIGEAEREAMSIYEDARQNSHTKSHTTKKQEVADVS